MDVDVALCGDRRVLPGLAVTVRSALENTTARLNIHVLGVGLSRSDMSALRRSWDHEKCGNISFAELSRDRIKRFRSTAYLKSKAAYARYFIAEIFPSVERCVYLDTDLLVLRDLKDAFEIDLKDNIAAAVRDVSTRLRSADPERRERLGMRDERNYFNSGFLVLDLGAWRREGFTEQLVRISIERFDKLDSQDQDALNILFENRTLLIDETWNTSQYEKPYPLSGRIVHLIGTIKPWHARYRVNFQESYYRDVIFNAFSEILGRTEFRNYRAPEYLGAGIYFEMIRQKIPTSDMLVGKLRRLARSIWQK